MTRLSSPFTFFVKLVLPLLYIGFGLFKLITTVFTIVSLQPAVSDSVKHLLFWAFLLSLLSALSIFEYLPLKTVYMDEKFLYISGYIREIRVPLSEIETVKGICLRNHIKVSITLKEASEFGRKIKFIAGIYGVDVVCSLRNAVEKAQSENINPNHI